MINYLESKGDLIQANLTNMNNNKLFYFIKKYYKLPILVVSREIDGKLYSQFECNLPFNFKNSPFFSDYTLTNKIKESGLYIFRHDTGKIALGSAMNFQRRLRDHINSFNNHRVPENLHKFFQVNGGINFLFEDQ